MRFFADNVAFYQKNGNTLRRLLDMTLATQGYVLPVVEVRLRPCQEFVSGLAQARPALRVLGCECGLSMKKSSIGRALSLKSGIHPNQHLPVFIFSNIGVCCVLQEQEPEMQKFNGSNYINLKL